MTDWDPIQAFLIELARRMPGETSRTSRVLEEVEDHLIEKTDELRRQGLDFEAARAAAVERFGTPGEVLHRFEIEAPLESEVRAMLRFALTLTAGVTTAFAALIFVFSWVDDAPLAVTFAKVALSIVIAAYNVVLLSRLWMRQPARPWLAWLVFGGGLLMIAIGAAGFVWTAHLGEVTGDWESYGFVCGALLVFQGALAAVQSRARETGARKLAT